MVPKVILGQPETNGRVLRLKSGDQLGEQLTGGKKGDGHRTVPLRLLVRQFRPGVLQLSKGVVGVPQQDGAVAVEDNTLAHPVKQLYSQIRLQARNGPAERGLGHPKLLRCPGAMLKFRHLLEV